METDMKVTDLYFIIYVFIYMYIRYLNLKND